MEYPIKYYKDLMTTPKVVIYDDTEHREWRLYDNKVKTDIPPTSVLFRRLFVEILEKPQVINTCVKMLSKSGSHL